MQCLNGRAPPYLSEHCIPVSSADTRRHLRSTNRHLLALPRFPLNTYGRRAFSVAGPMAWNSLPDFIQRDPTSSTDCLGVYLERSCSRVTSASSALAVLNDYADNAPYKSTHSLTHIKTDTHIEGFSKVTVDYKKSAYRIPDFAIILLLNKWLSLFWSNYFPTNSRVPQNVNIKMKAT